MKRLAVVLAVMVAAPLVRARDYGQDIVVASPEELYEMLTAGELDEESVDLLVALLENPLDLNRVDRHLLYDLPGVTYELADAIIAYRSSKGRIERVEELRQVPGMDDHVFDQILPFVTVTPAAEAGVVDVRKVRGSAKLGGIWRTGIDKPASRVSEIQYGPQAYLRVRGSGYTYFSGGLLATFRKRTVALWDFSRGYLVSEGPRDHLDLDSLYLHWGYGAWNVVAGSYDVGFGERLTFDSTQRRDPRGWYDTTSVYEDNERGKLRPREGLFGFAASMLGADLPGGWVDTTLFASTQLRDAYQYRGIIYGLDAYGAPGSCVETGCPDGYSCDVRDLTCRSTRLYDAEEPTLGYRYVTYKDAFRETLVGGNSTFNFDEGTHVGITAYKGYTDILLAEPANPIFSFSARYPRANEFGAIGINGRVQRGDLWASAEYAYTGRGGHAAYGRVVWEVPPFAETSLALRYYDARYENPRGRGESARDEFGGLAARNEEGIRLESVLKPLRALRVVTTVDAWRNTHQAVVSPGSLRFVRADAPQYDLHVSERVSLSLSRRERASLLLSYDNKDLENNSRAETYDDGDFFGRGEKRKAQLSFTTTRLPRTQLTATITAVLQDVRKLRDRFGFGDRYKLKASVRPFDGALLTASASYWAHQVEFVESSISNRDEPALDTYVDWKQTLPAGFIVRARYGLLHYRDKRPDRYAWYQLAKVSVEARF